MGKSNFVWGAPSFSQDISNNFTKTHHEEFITKELTFADRLNVGLGKKVEIEKESIFVKNDEAYLNSINSELIAPSNDVVLFSNRFLDFEFSEDDDLF
jgi:hypothetical protein